MPADRSAYWLTQRTRSLLGEFGKDKLRDGFSDDPEKNRNYNILEFLNSSLNDVVGTGAIKCDFYIAAIAGQGTYGLTTNIGQIDWVKWQGKLLSNVNEQYIYLNYATAYTADDPGGIPFHWWSNSDVLGLFPAPTEDDASGDTSIHFFAETYSADLVEKTDIPSRIPIAAQEHLATLAAYRIAGILARDDPATWAARQASLFAEWRDAKAKLEDIVQTRTPYEKDHIQVGGRRGLGRLRHRRR